MLMAIRSSDRTLMNAQDVEREEKPFVCPECGAEVILNQGEIYIPHYKHKPPITCRYGQGESEEHRQCKTAIYEALSTSPLVTKLAMERNLKTVRPDVSCYIKGVPVAIEVQCCSLQMGELYYRTSQYATKGIYVLWLSPVDQRVNDAACTNQNTVRLKQWEKWLSALYFGRVYYWVGNSAWGADSLTILPVHFDPAFTYVEATRWGGGYDKRLKSLRILHGAGWQHLVEDFQPRKREAWASDTMTLPAAHLYMDGLNQWWR